MAFSADAERIRVKRTVKKTENDAMEQRRKDIELSIRKKFHKQLFSRFARGNQRL